jgi:hypothetical protein
VNYMQYKLTRRQVGPLGVSVYTDSNPIRLRFDGCLGAPPPADAPPDEGDGGRSLFRQYPPEDPTGKGVKPSHKRWDETFEAAKGKFKATLASYYAWGTGGSSSSGGGIGSSSSSGEVVVGRTEAAVEEDEEDEGGEKGRRGLRRRLPAPPALV